MTESMVTAARLVELDALAEYVPPEVLSERLVEMLREQAGLGAVDVERLRSRLVGSAAMNNEGRESDGEQSTDDDERDHPRDGTISFDSREAADAPVAHPEYEGVRELELKRGSEAATSNEAGEAQPLERRCESCGRTKPQKSFHGLKTARCRACVKSGKGVEKNAPAKISDEVGSEVNSAKPHASETEPETPAATIGSNGSPTGAPGEATERSTTPATKVLKECQRCGKRKTLASFGKNANNADGFTHACSTCLRQLNSNKEYYQEADG